MFHWSSQKLFSNQMHQFKKLGNVPWSSQKNVLNPATKQPKKNYLKNEKKITSFRSHKDAAASSSLKIWDQMNTKIAL